MEFSSLKPEHDFSKSYIHLTTKELYRLEKKSCIFPNNFRIEYLILDHCVCRMNISKKELSGKWLIFMITSLALTWLKSNLVSLIYLMKNAECPKVNFTIYFIGLNPGKFKKSKLWKPFVIFLLILKFMYSEKATKFCEISTNYLSYVLPVKWLV